MTTATLTHVWRWANEAPDGTYTTGPCARCGRHPLISVDVATLLRLSDGCRDPHRKTRRGTKHRGRGSHR